MARREAEREDLMREATALRERVEMRVAGEADPVTAEFFGDGRLSIYFGSDPVFQFDRLGRLRRAFCHGNLYRSQGTTLARLNRVRSASATELERHDLDSSELERFLAAMRLRLQALLAELLANRVDILREVPEAAGVRRKLQQFLPDTVEGILAPLLRK